MWGRLNFPGIFSLRGMSSTPPQTSTKANKVAILVKSSTKVLSVKIIEVYKGVTFTVKKLFRSTDNFVFYTDISGVEIENGMFFSANGNFSGIFYPGNGYPGKYFSLYYNGQLTRG